MDNTSIQEEVFEKPWAVYDTWFGVTGIGLVTEKPSNKRCYIIYSESQDYFPELWDTNKVHFFNKIIEAVNYFLEKQCPLLEYPYSKEEITNLIYHSFPETIEQEKKKELTSLINLLTNLSYSQRLPKCTQQGIDQKIVDGELSEIFGGALYEPQVKDGCHNPNVKY